MADTTITPDDLYEFCWVDHVRLAPDGERFAFTLTRADRDARDNRSQIHVASPTEPPRAVSSGKKDGAAEWAHDGRIAFVGKRGPRAQVHVLDAGGGDARSLTSVPDGASALEWSPDGRRLAFRARALTGEDEVVDDEREPESPDQTRRPPVVRVVRRLSYKGDGQGYFDGRYQHLYVVDAHAEEGSERRLTGGAWNVEGFAWSPDGQRLAVTGNNEPDADRTTAKRLYTVAAVGGDPVELVGGDLQPSAPAWSPAGDLVAFLSPLTLDGGRHERVWVVGAGGGEPRCLTADWDRNCGAAPGSDMRTGHGARLVWDAAGERIWFIGAGRGVSEICSVGLEGDVRVEVASQNRAIYDFDLRGEHVVFCATDPWSPGDLYSFAGGRETRLSDFNPWLRERALAIPEGHTFTAADGLELDGWLLKPPTFTPDRKWPLVLQVHGGPHAQYGWTFFHEFQVLAGEGLLVLYLNPRGGDGRSDEFKHAVVRDWGGRDYEDLMTALDQLIEHTGYVDTERLGIAGGSYGGYMTNWAIGQTKRFSAAVAMRSISNLVSEYGQHDIVPWGRLEMGEMPWPDPDELWRRSPIRHVRDVETPLLLTHGEMDLRCAISQAEEMFGALRLLGKTVEMARFPGESHELSRSGRPDRRVERLTRIAGWFGRFLLRD